jgi:ABC-type amino acid transport substrate-binding protein
MKGRLVKRGTSVFVACMILCVAGCSQLRPGAAPVELWPDLLRVGVTPDAPPIIDKQGGRIEGLEADLALALGKELGWEVRFVELPWDDQIPALAEGRIDIVMSGMSVTQTRQSDVAFTDPYMAGGLMALVRRDETDQFAGPFAFITATQRVAVQTETTGDYFVQKYMKKAQRSAYDTVTEAFQALQMGRTDLMIHDAPVIWHLAAGKPSSCLVPARPRLTVEYYAWAVRPDNTQLLEAANVALDRWKADGTLQDVLHRWVPLAE